MTVPSVNPYPPGSKKPSVKDSLAAVSAAVSSQFPGSRTVELTSTMNRRSASDPSTIPAPIMNPDSTTPGISMLAAQKAIARKRAEQEALQQAQISARLQNSAAAMQNQNLMNTLVAGQYGSYNQGPGRPNQRRK